MGILQNSVTGEQEEEGSGDSLRFPKHFVRFSPQDRTELRAKGYFPCQVFNSAPCLPTAGEGFRDSHSSVSNRRCKQEAVPAVYLCSG